MDPKKEKLVPWCVQPLRLSPMPMYNQFTMQVSAKDHMRFQMMFGNILKVHMDGLRKRDRAKAKKKKKLTAD
jgi:hypothetical protein